MDEQELLKELATFIGEEGNEDNRIRNLEHKGGGIVVVEVSQKNSQTKGTQACVSLSKTCFLEKAQQVLGCDHTGHTTRQQKKRKTSDTHMIHPIDRQKTRNTLQTRRRNQSNPAKANGIAFPQPTRTTDTEGHRAGGPRGNRQTDK